MFDQILDWADPYIAEFIFGIIATYFGWIFTHIFKSKESQDNLHRALDSGVDTITDIIAHAASTSVGGADRMAGAVGDAAVDKVLSYVKKSVPDSVKYLKADQIQLRNMAIAKIARRVAELTPFK